jgi:hypothetical protein
MRNPPAYARGEWHREGKFVLHDRTELDKRYKVEGQILKDFSTITNKLRKEIAKNLEI